MHWDIVRYTGEYHKDFEEAQEIFRVHLGLPRGCGFNEQMEQLLAQAAHIACKYVGENGARIRALAEAAEGKEQLSRNEIRAVVEREDR